MSLRTCSLKRQVFEGFVTFYTCVTCVTCALQKLTFVNLEIIISATEVKYLDNI